MSDEELDKLFREAAEGFKAPHDSAAWKDMTRRLDQQPISTPPRFWNWKMISFVSLIGLTGIGGLWYTLKDQSAEVLSNQVAISEKDPAVKNSSPEVEVKSSQETGEVSLSAGDKSGSGITPVVDTEENTVKSPPVNVPSTKKINSPASKPGAPPDNHFSSRIVKNDVIEVKEEIGGDNPSTVSASVLAGSSMNPEEGQPGKDVQETVPQSLSSRSGSESDAPVALDSANKITKSGIPVKDTTGITEAAYSSKKDQDNKKGKGSSVSIKLVVAPDFSSIDFFSPDKSGFNYGVLMGYSFNPRWSVYSGAIYSKKIYSTDEIDKSYTNSGGYDYPINELYGDCRVIDIPMNAYYTFFPDQSFSIKAGLGFSSYIMLQEEYTYYVDNPYGPDEYQQSISNENNEWFKMLNVSVMFQKKLSNRFYLELEPFLKAPLAGVGEGEVSLVSMGAFFNLRFDIPIANKP